MDESGLTTVQAPEKIITEMGTKQVGCATSGERGTLFTIVGAINAIGNKIPPMFIFPRVNYKDYFITGSPVGSIGAASKSGWINEDIFMNYLQHFAKHAKP